MRLLWLDLETTGLDETKDVILEVAVVITEDLRPVSWVTYLVAGSVDDAMGIATQYVRDMHTKNKLWSDMREHRNRPTLAKIEESILGLIGDHYPIMERPILAGSSIHFDRRFIARHMPRLEAHLHHRMLDVSAWKVVFEGMYGVKFKKNEAHRAHPDILESLRELETYLGTLSEDKLSVLQKFYAIR